MQLPPRALHTHHTGVEGGPALRQLWGGWGPAVGQRWASVKLGMEVDFICPMRSDRLLSKHEFSRADGYTDDRVRPVLQHGGSFLSAGSSSLLLETRLSSAQACADPSGWLEAWHLSQGGLCVRSPASTIGGLVLPEPRPGAHSHGVWLSPSGSRMSPFAVPCTWPRSEAPSINSKGQSSPRSHPCDPQSA